MGLQTYEYGLKPQDGFEVITHFEFTSQHLDILNRLFTPLIGVESIGLYHFMSQFIDESQHLGLTHYIFMNELKINLLDFREQMDNLEAIGLIKTFVRHEEKYSHFVYELIQPPTAYQFFNDPMLSVFLFSEVDKKRYQALKSYFEKDEKDLSKYQQTTRKFTEVFNVPKKVNVSDQINLKQIKHYNGIDLSNETFDFEMLRQMLNHHFISNEIIDKEAKNLIIQLATLYGITEDGMKNVILSSITSAQQLSFEEMRKQARTYYLIEHDNQLPKLEHQTYKTNDEKKDRHTKDTTNDWLQLLDETSPIDMLASWSDSEPTQSQKSMIEELINREKMNFGVINILLQFVMLKEDMKLPKSYIFEIASNWKKIGVSNAKQAYEYALQVNQPKNYETHSNDKRQNNRGRQNQFLSKEKTPKWLQNRDNQEDNKDINDDTLEEDRQAFLEKLNQKWKEEDN